MPQVPVEVKKTTPAPAPDVWQSFRSEMDRLFDRFAGGFGFPSFRRCSTSNQHRVAKVFSASPHPRSM
jgi:hypothetical protein